MKKIDKNKNLKNTKEEQKNKKSYFSSIFIVFSFLMFFILIFSLAYFKNTLFMVKDEISLETIRQSEANKIFTSEDIFVDIKKSDKSKQFQPLDNNLDPFLGKKGSKKINLFYFSDFDCSFCHEQEEIIKNVYNKYSDKLLIIWKDYPDVSSVNNFSYQAARAARCAQEQNSFWEYNDLLYKNKNNSINPEKNLFFDLAEKLELNLASFLSCMNESKVDNLILDNVREAESLGIMGVPYIYINDKDFIGNISEDDLEKIIKNEIDKIE